MFVNMLLSLKIYDLFVFVYFKFNTFEEVFPMTKRQNIVYNFTITVIILFSNTAITNDSIYQKNIVHNLIESVVSMVTKKCAG